LAEKYSDLKIVATRMRGIVKMVRDTLTAAFYETQQKHAHPTFATLQILEKARFAVWRGALKIRVSLVRFQSRPPFLKPQRLKTPKFFVIQAVLVSA
jgi:hypothetical protein